MVVEIIIVGQKKITRKIDVDNITIEELMEKLGLLASEYVVLKNGLIVSDKDVVRNGDKIILYPVKSGG